MVKVKRKPFLREIKPWPAHYNASILPPLIVLVHLRNHFEDTGQEEKRKKCEDAIWNFKIVRPDWDDFV